MVEAPVVNASPLIVLARSKLLDLLQLLGEHVIVPACVVEEVSAHSDEASRALASQAWLKIVPPQPISDAVAAWDLGPGESAVLAWALSHPGSVAVLDDFAARKCGLALGVAVKGTLGLTLLAKARGRFSAARPIVERMRNAGLYLSDEVIEQVLGMVGE